MRTAISSGQWQPWLAVSALLAKTAVHGFHCPGADVAVRMRMVLARPWVGYSSVSLAFIVHHRTNQVNTCVHDLILIHSVIEEFTL